ncbi:MAG: NAD-dependent epimerase/dehydratase family protein [Promethearchaeota archaeon]
MKILLTGAFGNVGLSTLEELIERGHDIRVFELKNDRNMKLAKKYENKVELIWGDLRNYLDVEKAVSNVDIVIHVGALIPPMADKHPKLAEKVNVGGTRNIIKAMELQKRKPKLIFTSSIAIYGDRREIPLIKITDPINPNEDDGYAKQKVQCEQLIQNSTLDWLILRLTYIVSMDKLALDPLMFHMPLETCIEICHTKDVGLAIANAIDKEDIWGQILNIAGGPKCRIIYRDYIHKMLDLFGLGGDLLPQEAFSNEKFHCGFMDTKKSQELLKYQRYSLEDYFEEVKKKVEFSRFMNLLFPLIVRPFAKRMLLSKSPFYKTEA